MRQRFMIVAMAGLALFILVGIGAFYLAGLSNIPEGEIAEPENPL
ncbi:hypothetical protein [Fulvimarina manganoxydans]|nr:hypothetical protein [Fulvimarina manganoxydans]